MKFTEVFIESLPTTAEDRDYPAVGHANLGSLLISGPAGSGRTSFAARLAWHMNFSHVGVVAADALKGVSDLERIEVGRVRSESSHYDLVVYIYSSLKYDVHLFHHPPGDQQGF